MSQWMDLLRGPVFGVIIMIILFAGAIIYTAFAALIAQMGLLFRLKALNTSEKRAESIGSETGKGDYVQEFYGQGFSVHENQRTSSPHCQRSPSEHPRRGQVEVVEPDTNEVVDATWWEAVK